MGQIERAPFGVVKTCLSEWKLPGLGKIALTKTKSLVFHRVITIAEDKLLAKIEEQLLARGHGKTRMRLVSRHLAFMENDGARPGSAGASQLAENANPDEIRWRRDMRCIVL